MEKEILLLTPWARCLSSSLPTTAHMQLKVLRKVSLRKCSLGPEEATIKGRLRLKDIPHRGYLLLDKLLATCHLWLIVLFLIFL